MACRSCLQSLVQPMASASLAVAGPSRAFSTSLRRFADDKPDTLVSTLRAATEKLGARKESPRAPMPSRGEYMRVRGNDMGMQLIL
jgi:hypothetical protein